LSISMKTKPSDLSTNRWNPACFGRSSKRSSERRFALCLSEAYVTHGCFVGFLSAGPGQALGSIATIPPDCEALREWFQDYRLL
jgi:hypothetical protein